MRSLLRTILFFIVVPPLPRLMLHAFAVITVISVAGLGLDPHRAPGAAIPILTLQVFATSTGFAAHARRGHYDLLLTGGVGRVRTAIVQWLMAAAPGVASVGVLAAAEAALAGTRTTLASGTMAALFLVTTLPWAATVALPRFSGAIGWILLVVVTRSLTAPGDGFHLAWSANSDPGWVAALGFLIFPVGAAGSDIGGKVLLLAQALVGGVVSMAIALRWIQQTPLALETGQ
jgi:hypothetical protein